MTAQLYVIDTSAERRDLKALQQIRGAILAHVGAVGQRMASPSDDTGEDLVTCNAHVCAMFKLIDEAAVILDRSN